MYSGVIHVFVNPCGIFYHHLEEPIHSRPEFVTNVDLEKPKTGRNDRVIDNMSMLYRAGLVFFVFHELFGVVWVLMAGRVASLWS